MWEAHFLEFLLNFSVHKLSPNMKLGSGLSVMIISLLCQAVGIMIRFHYLQLQIYRHISGTFEISLKNISLFHPGGL